MPLISKRGDMPSARELARRIKAERLRLGLSVREAATRLQITPTSYESYEICTGLKAAVLIALVRAGYDLTHLVPELLTAEPLATPVKAGRSA
jgi:transcriptional regulator with XRE-family HTH domain